MISRFDTFQILFQNVLNSLNTLIAGILQELQCNLCCIDPELRNSLFHKTELKTTMVEIIIIRFKVDLLIKL